MKFIFSLNTQNTSTFYKGAIPILILFLLTGCDVCQEPLEEQAIQHKSALDKKHQQLTALQEQISLLDTQIENQKQTAAESKMAYNSELIEMQEQSKNQQNKLNSLQQTLDKNQAESIQVISQLEQKNTFANEKISTLKHDLKQNIIDTEQLLSTKDTIESELKALQETHQQTQQGQQKLQQNIEATQERLDLTQSVLVERGLQLADQEKKILAITDERNQLQDELSNREVQLPPMYESTDPKAQVELNVLYTHLVEEQKQRIWLNKQFEETQEKLTQLDIELTESHKTIIVNKELAASWEEKQKLSTTKIDELNQQLTTSKQINEQISIELQNREAKLKKLHKNIQAIQDNNGLLIQSNKELQSELETALGDKQEALLEKDSIAQQLSETNTQLEKYEMQLMDSKQLQESSKDKINQQKTKREELESHISTLKQNLEKIHVSNTKTKNDFAEILQKLTIEKEELQSSLNTVTQSSQQQELQLQTTLQELKQVQNELATKNAEEKARLKAEEKAKDIYHTVQPGESLSNIAKEYYDDINLWQKILDANGLDNPDMIQPGQNLLIPKL